MKISPSYQQVMRLMLWMVVALLGGYYFPLNGMFAPLSILPLISFFLFYGIAGNLLISLYGKHRTPKIAGMTFLLTTLGMLGRYLMEGDPVAAGFTLENILVHVITITLYVVLAYVLLKPANQ